MASNTYDPSNGVLRSAWEKRTSGGLFQPGLPYGVNWVDHPFASEDIALERSLIDTGLLNPGGQQSEGLPGKFQTTAQSDHRAEPEALGYFLAAFQRNGETPTVLTAGQSFSHPLAPSYTDVAFPKSRTVRLGRDDGKLVTAYNVQPSQFAFAFNQNQAIGCVMSEVFERSTDYNLAAVVTETSGLTEDQRPWLRGSPGYAAAIDTAANSRIYIRLDNNSTGAASCKIGPGGSYDSITLVNGGWVTVLDGSGNVVGDPDNPVQVYINSFAAGTNLDEWSFDLVDLTHWTQSLSVLQALNEIDASLLIDGSSFRIQSGGLTLAKALEADTSVGGAFGHGVRSAGLRIITGNVDVRYVDQSVANRLKERQPFALTITLSSNVNIGSSTDKYQIQFYMPRCRFNGRTARISSGSAYTQAPGFTAYPLATDPLPDDVTVTLQNGISDMTV